MTDLGLLDDGSRLLSRRQTIRLVSTWIEAGRPAAVVRFLEGEGRLLAADAGDKLSMKVAIKKLRRQTGLGFSPAQALKVKALVLNAFDRADVLGIRPGATFPDEHRQWMELIAATYRDRVANGREPAYLAHCMLKEDLYSALPELLAVRETVSIISCRDVRSALEARCGLADVAVYQVPSQYVVRDVDGDYESALHDVPIWPDFYRGLREGLVVRNPGEVFLVGAGVFGKDLCIRVKELGGIALDMGSTLDSMADKVTRGRHRPAFRPLPETPTVV